MDASKTTDSRRNTLADEEFEKIAKRAADIVMDQVALRIGQSVIKLGVYLIVVLFIAAYLWVTGKEIIK